MPTAPLAPKQGTYAAYFQQAQKNMQPALDTDVNTARAMLADQGILSSTGGVGKLANIRAQYLANAQNTAAQQAEAASARNQSNALRVWEMLASQALAKKQLGIKDRAIKWPNQPGLFGQLMGVNIGDPTEQSEMPWYMRPMSDEGVAKWDAFNRWSDDLGDAALRLVTMTPAPVRATTPDERDKMRMKASGREPYSEFIRRTSTTPVDNVVLAIDEAIRKARDRFRNIKIGDPTEQVGDPWETWASHTENLGPTLADRNLAQQAADSAAARSVQRAYLKLAQDKAAQDAEAGGDVWAQMTQAVIGNRSTDMDAVAPGIQPLLDSKGMMAAIRAGFNTDIEALAKSGDPRAIKLLELMGYSLPIFEGSGLDSLHPKVQLPIPATVPSPSTVPFGGGGGNLFSDRVMSGSLHQNFKGYGR